MRVKKNIPLFVLSLIFSLFCMYMIFMFSYQSGDESSGVSISLYDIFIKYTHFDFISHNAFRKLAHFSEFAALGLGVCSCVYYYSAELRPLVSLVFCAGYAALDEIHQVFVPERAGRVFDVFVDSCGAAAGILIFTVIAALFIKRKRFSAVR